jgi:outer membrane receptor for ferrienterochelin and colicins
MAAACMTCPAWGQAPEVPNPAPPPSAPLTVPQQLEVRGSRDVETQRRSVAPKIVLGRDEIERYGDANVLDVLKRLPSVVVPAGNSGTSGPRLRGLSNGFTTILIDERPVPEGFSLDTLATELVERIEVLRAPTAATGLRGIAGVINIVLREASETRVNDWRGLLELSRAGVSPRLGYSGNASLGELTTHTTLSAFRRQVETSEGSVVTRQRVSDDALIANSSGRWNGKGSQTGMSLSTRSVWRGVGGERLEIRPSFGATNVRTALSGLKQPDEDDGSSQVNLGHVNRTSKARNWQLDTFFAHALQAARVQWRAIFGESKASAVAERSNVPNDPSEKPSTSGETTKFKDRIFQGSMKTSLGTNSGHAWDGGLEVHMTHRSANGLTRVGDRSHNTQYEDDLKAKISRVSLFAQNEWAMTSAWAAQLGLRADHISTQAERDLGQFDRVRSTIVAPVAHLRWRAPMSEEQLLPSQVRMSLTRTYNAPTAAQLLSNPIINRDFPSDTRNTEFHADFASNSALRPERCWGLDVAYERYLNDGGVLSASAFHRRIDDLIRNTVTLESVPWAPQLGRYVSRPRNIGKAATSGVELDARVRLSELIEDGPNTSLRANVSVLRSKVRSVPGANNRLVEQPKGTLYLDVNHRFRGSPLSIGVSNAYTPGYRLDLQTRRSVAQTKTIVTDAYAVWAISSQAQVRLSVANALARDRVRTTDITTAPTDGLAERQLRTVRQRSDAVIGVRLELKL